MRSSLHSGVVFTPEFHDVQYSCFVEESGIHLNTISIETLGNGLFVFLLCLTWLAFTLLVLRAFLTEEVAVCKPSSLYFCVHLNFGTLSQPFRMGKSFHDKETFLYSFILFLWIFNPTREIKSIRSFWYVAKHFVRVCSQICCYISVDFMLCHIVLHGAVLQNIKSLNMK